MCISDLMTLEVVCSDYGSRIVKKKKLHFAIFALYMVLLLVAIIIPPISSEFQFVETHLPTN